MSKAQIAVLGSDIKIYLSDNGEPEGKDGVLFTLVPVVHEHVQKHLFKPDLLLAELAIAFGCGSQAYELKKIDHRKSTTKDFMVQYFQRKSTLAIELGTNWRESEVEFVYLVRGTGCVHGAGTVEVYPRECHQQLLDDLSAFNPLFAQRVVIPDSPTASKCTVLN